MKILYVAPHLSTGGMPQYLYKQISYFYKDHEVEVVDVTNSGGDSFVVQKNKIANLVPIHTLGDKSELLTIVQDFNPDVIHYQEIPQDFLPVHILNELFKDDRTHFNIVTTHSSFTNPDTISHHPDKYVFVCEWSRQKFAHLGIPSDVWEYPIENYVFDKEVAQKRLFLDPTWKHVLHVGLFTPGKNQLELFAIASQLEKYKIKFHFVGNQAGNFKDYWEPLMQHIPDNCVVWGEHDDVGKFYEAMDLFYFPSKFELSPIAIKEALSYGLPCMFRKLDTYLDMYDTTPNVTYITSDITSNLEMLFDKLKPEKRFRIQALHLLTGPEDPREEISINSIRKLQDFGIDYVQIYNKRYTELPPKEHCRRPDDISMEVKTLDYMLGTITPGHYGCYLAHTGALKQLSEDYDYTLIFEADAILNVSEEEFVDIVHKACVKFEKTNVRHITFSDNPADSKIDIDKNFLATGYKQDYAHCYLVANRHKDWWLEQIKTVKWDSADLWYNDVFYFSMAPRYTTKKVYCRQTDGYSLLDLKYKDVQ